MPSTSQIAESRTFAVEVSGWDSSDNFFVERCDLTWHERSGKQVCLRQPVRENTILLVRLLDSGERERSHPIVYKARLIGKTESGLRQFLLHASSPRAGEREYTRER
ncbi:MAG TPA: hypothetical protein VJN93_04050 [Candidatus Acidoferrum sp.]|nr:hypothetical protein [Candidatus Acidoferrum sp.]